MQPSSQQPQTVFYRLPQVRQICGGVAASTIWAWAKAGKFPRPIKLSENCTVWEAKAVEEFLQSRIAASQAGEGCAK